MTGTERASAVGYPGALGTGQFTEVNGLHTWWTTAGEGESPLVLVYGGNIGSGSCANTWSSTFERLSQLMPVIAFDRPGNGFTDAPAKAEDFTMEFVINHLIGLLEELDLGPVNLLGHSRGGFIVTRTALLRQDLVKSVTVVTSGTLGPGVGMNAVALAGNPHPRFSEEWMRWSYSNYSYDPSHVTDAWLKPFMDVMARDEYQLVRRRIDEERLLERFFLPELMRDKRETLRWLDEGRLQRPVHILWGLSDKTVPVRLGYDLFKTLSRHETRVAMSVADKTGHFPFREVPDWFDDTVRGFLSEVDADV
jgi:2-hydroxy-6-oxonona-2,4-dienedioate hydrolase